MPKVVIKGTESAHGETWSLVNRLWTYCFSSTLVKAEFKQEFFLNLNDPRANSGRIGLQGNLRFRDRIDIYGDDDNLNPANHRKIGFESLKEDTG